MFLTVAFGGNMDKFTEKQKQFLIDVINENTARINILSGSVRSGKTFISLLAFILMVTKSEKTDTFLIAGKTITALKRNCFGLISDICGKDFKYSTISKYGEILGRKVYFEGANDSRAENKIRGMTLTGAYCDEITLFTEDFFSMLLSRLSAKNAFLLGTTNPDSPNHWLKKKYINRKDKLSLKLWEFLIDDNTTLSEEFITNTKKEHIGVYYDRFILGKWVQAEGLIYRVFADNNNRYIFDKLPEKLAFITIGIDYGASVSKTAFIATGFSQGLNKVYILKENYIEGTAEPTEIYQRFREFYFDIYNTFGNATVAFADYGALGQIITKGIQTMCMSYGLPIRIKDCKKGTINDRIQLTCQLFGQDRLFIHKDCKHTIGAFNNAVWQENKVDTRLDDGSVEIDFLDAFEYSINDFNKKLVVRSYDI